MRPGGHCRPEMGEGPQTRRVEPRVVPVGRGRPRGCSASTRSSRSGACPPRWARMWPRRWRNRAARSSWEHVDTRRETCHRQTPLVGGRRSPRRERSANSRAKPLSEAAGRSRAWSWRFENSRESISPQGQKTLFSASNPSPFHRPQHPSPGRAYSGSRLIHDSSFQLFVPNHRLGHLHPHFKGPVADPFEQGQGSFALDSRRHRN